MDERYRVQISKQARDIRRLSPLTCDAAFLGASNGWSRTHVRWVVRGSPEEPMYRVRQGSYRILYTTEDDVLVVEVVTVGHRSDVNRDR